jgi:holo-[acyl-carrier protein] synthase
MIFGIGTDIIEISRVKKAMQTLRFCTRFFTPEENEYFQQRNGRAETVAGNFAAKEAIAKAFGTGVRGFSLTDIEVLRDALGKPVVNLKGKLAAKAQELGIESVSVSISHCKEYAVAYALIEK